MFHELRAMRGNTVKFRIWKTIVSGNVSATIGDLTDTVQLTNKGSFTIYIIIIYQKGQKSILL